MIRSKEETIQRGIELFNAGNFFEAHEALEPLWLETANPIEKKFLQGLIMMAGSFYHYKNHSCAGAAVLLEKSVTALTNTKSAHPEIDIDVFLSAVEKIRAEVEGCWFDIAVRELPKITKTTMTH